MCDDQTNQTTQDTNIHYGMGVPSHLDNKQYASYVSMFNNEAYHPDVVRVLGGGTEA